METAILSFKTCLGFFFSVKCTLYIKLQVIDRIARNLLSSCLALRGQTLLFTQLLKTHNVLNVWNKPDCIAATVEPPGPDHTDIPHGVSCVKFHESDFECFWSYTVPHNQHEENI